MKLCKDCKHSEVVGKFMFCYRPRIDFVTGVNIERDWPPHTCEFERMTELNRRKNWGSVPEVCTDEAKFWEPKCPEPTS